MKILAIADRPPKQSINKILSSDSVDLIITLGDLDFFDLKELKDGAVGSSSRRRDLQLKLINKDVLVKNIRGNIDTRIQKLKDGLYDGIILALAGIKTLKLEENVKYIFPIEEMLPAVGQGIIAVQCRKDDTNIIKIFKRQRES